MGPPSKVRGRRATPGPGRRLAPRKEPRRTSESRSDNSTLSNDIPCSSKAAFSIDTAAATVAVAAASDISAAAVASSDTTASNAHRSRSRRARSLPRAGSLHRARSRVTDWSPITVDPPLTARFRDEVPTNTVHKDKRLTSQPGPDFEADSPDNNPGTSTSNPGAVLTLKPSLKKNSSGRIRDSARRIRFVVNTDPTEDQRTTRFRRGSPFRCRRPSSGSSSDGRGDDRYTVSWSANKDNVGIDTEAEAHRSPSRTPSPTTSSATLLTQMESTARYVQQNCFVQPTTEFK